MDELRDMSSKTNSLEGIKEKYKKAIIDNYRERLTILRNKGEVYEEDIEEARRTFNNTQYRNAFDDSLGSNERWGIVSKRNFFGLSAEIFPENSKGIKKDNRLYLRLTSGRFQMQKFPTISNSFFPNAINISDILERSENGQFAEVEEFYNMNNREVLEKYGITAFCDDKHRGQANLIANCVILDSLLQENYSEMKDVFCYTLQGYVIKIKLEDGTEINANSTDLNADSQTDKKGITIRKEGKEATVGFSAISIGDKPDILTNINDLEVENVVYTGDAELITQLQQAMQEQFESQCQQVKLQNETIVPEHENYYARYNEIAGKLLDKADVCSYDEEYELEGLAISCINDGSSVCIKSTALGIGFLIDSEMCKFHDLDNLVEINYYLNEKNLEPIESQNKEIIEKIKEFAEKLEALAREDKTKGEKPQVANDLLLNKVISGGVKTSDVQSFQKTLKELVEKSSDKPNLTEKDSHNWEGK